MNQRSKAWVTPLLVMLLIGILLGFVIFRVGSLSDRLDRSQSDRTDLHRQLQQQEKASQTLAKQVRKLGGTPLVTPPVEVTSGPSGPAGGTGPVGPRGPIGATGATGKTGAQGVAGQVGPIGPTGAIGPEGPKGDVGSKGPAGDKGDAGPAGPVGPAGADGKDGAPGQQGPAGSAGSVTPGDYACPSGQYVAGFHVAADGSVSLDCAGVLAPAAGPTP